MPITTQSEKDFLKKLIINQFNDQFGTSYAITDFNIYSIAPKTTHKIGYELTTNQLDNGLQLRAFFNFDTDDEVSSFQIGLLSTADVGGLDDEIYVCFGTINQYYLDSGLYNFVFIDNPFSGSSFIVDDDSNIFSDNNDNFLIYYG